MDSPESMCPDHSDLVVVKTGVTPIKTKKSFVFTGMAAHHDFRVYNSRISTIERALKERVYYVKDPVIGWTTPHRPSELTFTAKLRPFKEAMDKLARVTTPMQRDEFVSSYQGRKRTIYQNATDWLQRNGFTAKCARVKAFVKTEKYNFTLKKDPAPRIIQPRDATYLVESGRYIKSIEKKVYKNINNIFGSVTVFKGLNAAQRGDEIYKKWKRFTDPVAISLDATRFDEHVSNAALKFESGIYHKYFYCRYFSWLMSLQRDNIGTARAEDGWLKYKTKHNRMSGDPNTSLGNVVIMCGILYSYFKEYGLAAELVNDGDDCVIIMERKDLYKLNMLETFYHECGFRIEVEEPVYKMEHIDFCQCRPVEVERGVYLMVRNPKVTLSKDSISLKPLNTPLLGRRWLKSVGEGGKILCSGIPVMQHYYSCMLRNAGNVKALVDPTLDGGLFRLSKGMEERSPIITDTCRVSFWEAFGITPSDQRVLEDYYSTHSFSQAGSENMRFAYLPVPL